jgi:hypothetical protein
MAIFLQSPGVQITETDLTGFIPTPATTGGAFVGQFEWGPVEDYTVIQNKRVLEQVFGKPSEVNYRDWYSASNFLDYSGNLNLIRVVSEDALNSTADGLGLLIKNVDNFSATEGTPAGDAAILAARYPGAKGDGLKVSICDASTWDTWDSNYKALFDTSPGTSDYAEQKGGLNDELHIVVVDTTGEFSGIPDSVLEKFAFVSKGRDAIRLDGEPCYYGSIINKQSQYVYVLEVPESNDYAADGAVTGLNLTLSGSGYTSSPTVTISGNGTGATATALLSETGSLKSVTIVDGGTGYSEDEIIVVTGNGTGATAKVGTVDVSGVIQTIVVLTGGTDYSTIDLDLSGIGNGDATATGVIGYSIASLSIVTHGTGYDSATVAISGNGTGATATATTSPNGGYVGTWNTSVLNKKFKSLLTPWEKTLTGGTDGAIVTSNELITGWDMFRNSEVVDVSLLFTGAAGGDSSMTVVNKYVIDNIAESRKDCVVFFSPKYSDVVNQPENNATENVISTRSTINTVSSYAIMDSGWKYQYDKFADKFRWIPLNADIAGLAARVDFTNDPWYSFAGYSRGQIKNVVKLALNPSQTNRDELYKVGINPVVSFANEGVLLYGDKTQLAKPSAFQKINVRRLFIVLKKAIGRAAKYQLFEYNDTFTRSQFKAMVEPFLREVKGRRGISDWKVICDTSNNTGEVINRSEFVADIYIKPAMSINFIKLNFVAVGASVSFEEVVGVVG